MKVHPQVLVTVFTKMQVSAENGYVHLNITPLHVLGYYQTYFMNMIHDAVYTPLHISEACPPQPWIIKGDCSH